MSLSIYAAEDPFLTESDSFFEKCSEVGIQKAIRVLCEPGCTYELRCPNTDRGTVSGYFDSFSDLSATAHALDSTATAVYITLNPVHPDLLARANNCHKYRVKNTTGDEEVLKRTRLLIDCDPTRPAGISSSDPEHEAALKKCRDVRDYLRSLGFPEPLFGDSGNGGHLIYGIDLPNDPASAELVKRFLESLASRFDDHAVTVDRTVWNASRISKLYGTKSMKGDSTPSRPHRYSKILDTPDKLESVSIDLLRAVAELISQPAKKTVEKARVRSGSLHRKGDRTPEDVEQMMDAMGLDYRPRAAYKGGYRWELNKCPNATEHSTDPGGAAVFLLDGIVGFKCQHAHCADLHASDVFGTAKGTKSKTGKYDNLA
ncbi:MAG: hypothetical protein WCO71_08285, partial [Pseudomonadota bacterium]